MSAFLITAFRSEDMVGKTGEASSTQELGPPLLWVDVPIRAFGSRLFFYVLHRTRANVELFIPPWTRAVMIRTMLSGRHQVTAMIITPRKTT